MNFASDTGRPQSLLGSSINLCSLVAVLLLTVAIYRYAIWPKYFSPLRHLPVAPDCHWFFGHLLRILREPSGNPAREWIDTVSNDGMIRYYMWFSERVLVTNPEALSEVLVTKSYDFVKPSFLRNIVRRFTGDGIIIAEGNDHVFQRKHLAHAFSFRHVKDLHSVFLRKARELVKHLEQASTASPEIDASKWATLATLDIIGVSGLGQDFGALQNPDNDLARAYEDVFARPVTTPTGKRLQLLGLIIPNSIIKRIPISHNLIYNRQMAFIRSRCQSLIDLQKHRLAEKQATETNILSTAISSSSFSDEQLINQAMTFLASGHETVSTALQASLILLCRYPDIQTKLRAELRKDLPAFSADITSEQIEACHYLQAVCSEVLRLWPPVSMTWREAAKDTYIEGVSVLKGTTLVICPWAVNTSKRLWGDDARDFKPGRWLDKDGKANKSGGARSNFANLSFLHGPRSCIGQRFALSEYAVLLAAWIRSFEIAFVPGTPLAKGKEILKGSLTVKPEGGVRCTIRRIED